MLYLQLDSVLEQWLCCTVYKLAKLLKAMNIFTNIIQKSNIIQTRASMLGQLLSVCFTEVVPRTSLLHNCNEKMANQNYRLWVFLQLQVVCMQQKIKYKQFLWFRFLKLLSWRFLKIIFHSGSECYLCSADLICDKLLSHRGNIFSSFFFMANFLVA